MPVLYDLVLLLDPAADDQRRAQIRADVEATISAQGTLELAQEWGLRPMTFQIDHRADAEYQLIQFTGPPQLVGELGRSLRIADGVLRHRIIRVRPGTPPPPGPPPLRDDRDRDRGERGDRGDRERGDRERPDRGDHDRDERRAA